MGAVGGDVEDAEVVGEIIGGGGETLSPRLRALDIDDGTLLCGEGLNTLIEERCDHCKSS